MSPSKTRAHCDGAGEIVDGAVMVILIGVAGAAPPVCHRIDRVQLDGAREVGYGAIVFAYRAVAYAARVKGGRRLRVPIDSLRVARNGAPVLAHLVVTVSLLEVVGATRAQRKPHAGGQSIKQISFPHPVTPLCFSLPPSSFEAFLGETFLKKGMCSALFSPQTHTSFENENHS